jgi:hypothetical protein
MDLGWQEIILTAITTAGAVFGADRGAKYLKSRNGKTGNHPMTTNEYDDRKEMANYVEEFTRDAHDRECVLKLGPMHADLQEIKHDIKTLLRGNGK